VSGVPFWYLLDFGVEEVQLAEDCSSLDFFVEATEEILDNTVVDSEDATTVQEEVPVFRSVEITVEIGETGAQVIAGAEIAGDDTTGEQIDGRFPTETSAAATLHRLTWEEKSALPSVDILEDFSVEITVEIAEVFPSDNTGRVSTDV
jgi:hypothetical protein